MTTRKLLAAIVIGNSFLMTTTANARPVDQQPEPMFAASVQTYAYKASVYSSDSAAAAAPDSVFGYKAKAPQVPMNPAAVKYVQDYIRKNTEVLQKVEARSDAIFKIMEPILARYAVPAELKYLAVVESDLKRTAVSRVGAAGPWQLMPATARELGLKVSKKTDERKQYYKSTTAAAKYLRDLYTEYGDWLLVIAAYNAGPGNVNKAIRKAGSHNFWKLQALLPAETRGHVKRFISTHYFFEDGGSETTLTKAENKMYCEALARFANKQVETESAKTVAVVSADAIANDLLKENQTETVMASKQK